jgi:Mrp family chromosome partitioning ATPase/capsular polysaccharide biosynthesis protein
LGFEVSHEGVTLHDYVRVVRRRKWVIATTVLLIPLVAVILSMQQPKLFQAGSELLLVQRDISSSLTGIAQGGGFYPDRTLQTQADLARVDEVARRALKLANVSDLSPGQLLAATSVTPRLDADILSISVVDGDPARAATLATAYAEAFAAYKQELDTRAITRPLSQLEAEIAALERDGEQDTSYYQDLQEKRQALQTLQTLQGGSPFQVREAGGAAQIQPRPFRNGLIALMFGIVAGFGLAFLREALDTRVRTAEEVGERLHAPLLARLPEPPKRLASHDKLVMISEPASNQAEAFRMLRTNFEFVNLGYSAKVMMVTSAVESEGKSTSASNLAVALARSGKRVVLVDLDLRRPYLEKFFDLEGHPGLTDVALGHVELEDALVRITVTESPKVPRQLGGLNGHGNGPSNGKVSGLLEVLASGPLPPDAGEFVGTEAVAKIIRELRDRSDFVIVDAPPLLSVGDAMALTSRVEAVIIVTRLKVLKRATVKELHRVLETSQALVLGYVVTGADEDQAYGYGANYGYGYRRDTSRSAAREHDRVA